jgi:hypothetical protein
MVKMVMGRTVEKEAKEKMESCGTVLMRRRAVRRI